MTSPSLAAGAVGPGSSNELHRLLKNVRKWRARWIAKPPPLAFDLKGQEASDAIRAALLGAEPRMIARFGNTELNAALNWLAARDPRGLLERMRLYVRGELGAWWWDARTNRDLFNVAGFFPVTAETLDRFARRLLDDATQVDLLGSWLPGEKLLGDRLKGARTLYLAELEPYMHANPWTEALTGKRVLVVHPFVASIRRQYEKRRLLFGDPRVLPDFELLTLQAVQSAGGEVTRFPTWFDALDWMCGEISRVDFDVAIIGAGAYGFSLAAHCKRIGRKAVHLGGASQLMFGIRGRRWDRWEFYQKLANEHWTRPLPEETPRDAQIMEGATYF